MAKSFIANPTTQNGIDYVKSLDTLLRSKKKELTVKYKIPSKTNEVYAIDFKLDMDTNKNYEMPDTKNAVMKTRGAPIDGCPKEQKTKL